MPRYKTFNGLLVVSCLMLTTSAEPQTRAEPARAESTFAVQHKRGNGNPVIHWNRIANEIFPVAVGPVLDSRAMTILHAAIHDAVNGIDARYEPYTVALSSPGASLDAAVASAARDVMLALTLNQQPRIEQQVRRRVSWRARWTRERSGRATRSTGGPRQSRPTSRRWHRSESVASATRAHHRAGLRIDRQARRLRLHSAVRRPPAWAPRPVPWLGQAHAVRDRPLAPSAQRPGSIAQQALCKRRQLPQGVWQASRFVANARPDRHGLLLVRAIRDLERHRHDGDAAGAGGSVARCARSGAHELRCRRCGDRVLRRQISLPLLAALHRHPPRQRRRQRRDRGRSRVAAPAVDATGRAADVLYSTDSRLSIRRRHDVGRGRRSVDGASRRIGLLCRDERHTAWRDPALQELFAGSPRSRPVARLWWNSLRPRRRRWLDGRGARRSRRRSKHFSDVEGRPEGLRYVGGIEGRPEGLRYV